MKLRMLATLALTTATLHSALAQEPAVEPAPGAPPPAAPAPMPAPMPAPAAEAATGFGAGGQLVLSADLPFMHSGPQFAIVHESVSMGGGSATLIDIQPSVDYFVAPNFSIGALVGIEHGSLDGTGGVLSGTTITAISVEGRVGYNVPLGDGVSIWPRLGIGYAHESVSSNGSPDTTAYIIPLSVTVPVLWHPGGHFFIGAGPAFMTQLVSKTEGNDNAKTTDYGITALIGGTIGGS